MVTQVIRGRKFNGQVLILSTVGEEQYFRAFVLIFHETVLCDMVTVKLLGKY